VWAFLSDFTTTEEWDPPTVSTVRVTGDGKLAAPLFAVGLERIGHDAARQMAERLDRLTTRPSTTPTTTTATTDPISEDAR
jgi:hypothetical protein